MSVLVIGDVMLDVYIEGVVKRISPEAPVPVLQAKRMTSMLGGAGNVARNVVALNCGCTLLSVVGLDDTAKKIAAHCHEARIRFDFTYLDSRLTTSKTRYEAQGQQILRVDDEDATELSKDEETNFATILGSYVRDSKVIVLSDYAKGVLTPDLTQWIISQAREHGNTVIVDPKHKNLKRYAGASIIKPNAEELAQATGMPTGTKEECLAAGFLVRDTFNIDTVLVTRGDKGMIMCTHNGFYELAAHQREVSNVVGAGDTALAALAVAIDQQDTLPKAMQFANMAASIAVGKHGTAAVTRREITDAFFRA